MRKPTRARNPPEYLKDYVRSKHDIGNFISYQYCSPPFQSFITSLDSGSIPSHWELAIKDPKWREAMLDEMRALEKK